MADACPNHGKLLAVSNNRQCLYAVNSSRKVGLMSVRSLVLTQIKTVAEEQKKKLPPLTDDLALLDSGLDSLCLAIVVARLEDELGYDPFSTEAEVDLPVTVSDFIRFYEDAPK
jgi:acyl carrier protein